MTAALERMEPPVRTAIMAEGGIDWRKVGIWGFVGGIGMVLVSLVGMLEGLDARLVIDPILSFGYLFLLGIPFVVGYVATRRDQLEGVESRNPDTSDVAAGAVTGIIGGLGVSLLILLLDNVDVRDILVNWSPQLLDLLTFGQSVGLGIVLMILSCTVLGAAGAALHLLSPTARRLIGAAISWLLILAVSQPAVVDFLEGLQLDGLGDLIYANSRGLSFVAAVVVAALAAGLSYRYAGTGDKLRTRYFEMPQTDRTRVTTYGLVVTTALVIILPFVFGKLINELLANVGLFILLALGLNVVVGYAGILDLGYVAFFAVGAYATAVLTSPLSPRWAPELSWWLAIPIVVVVAAIVGLLIGTPVIRMRGDYLAIVTLGFGEIIRILFLSDWLAPTFGGAQGIRNIPGVPVPGGEIDGTNPQGIFYLVMVFVAIATYVSWRLEKSRLGRAWMAIREDEKVAEAMGVNTVTTKLFAFVVGAVLASFSGAIFAAKLGTVFPSSFELLVSIIILVIVIVGGMGYIPGVMVGAIVLIGVLGGPTQPGLLAEFAEFKLLIYGALLVFMMLQKPEGLVPSAVRNRELHQEEYLQDAWLRSQVDDDEAASAEATAETTTP